MGIKNEYVTSSNVEPNVTLADFKKFVNEFLRFLALTKTSLNVSSKPSSLILSKIVLSALALS